MSRTIRAHQSFTAPPELTVEDILARAMSDMNSGCWLWERGSQASGYGSWPIPKRRRQLAHRMAYAIVYGPIPAGMMVCHKCDNPHCVNPDHLFLGTQTDNMRDCARKGRNKPAGLFGEGHPQAKLTEKQVIAIRADERSLRQIAAEYGVRYNYISQIKNRRSWKHVK